MRKRAEYIRLAGNADAQVSEKRSHHALLLPVVPTASICVQFVRILLKEEMQFVNRITTGKNQYT